MKELNVFSVLAIGFISYPILKFVTIAIFDKIATSCEEVTRPSED